MRDDDASGRGAARARRPPAQALGTFGSFEQVVMSVALVVLLGAISWGVLSRYVVATPATWVEEVASISFAWLIFVGAAEVHRRWQHVSVDLLTSLLPSSVQRPLGIAVEVLVIAFCAYAAFLGAAQAYVSHSSTTSILRIPLSVSYVGLTLGFFLMAFRGLQHLVWRGRRTSGEG
jgi:TRAP-type C4-dicarboxylate transport system permease small subunit